MLASRLDMKSHMADHILFEKESNIVTLQLLHISHRYLLKKIGFYKDI